MASREALQKLIQFGNAEQFATHAEDWSACSSAAILNAAVEQLGKLTQQRAVSVMASVPLIAVWTAGSENSSDV